MKPTSRGPSRAGYLRVVILVLVTGYVDAFGLLKFQTFVSFMSGNTTTSGLLIGQGAFAAALPALVAILGFLCGVFCGAAVAIAQPVRAQQMVFALAAMLIALHWAANATWRLDELIGIVMLSVAMGALNTSVSRIGVEPVNIGYVSGTLNRMADHAARAVARQPLADAQTPGDTHMRRALLLGGVWSAFFGGAILSSAGNSRFGDASLLLPLVVLAAFTVLEPRAPSVVAVR